jgi:hypothetical protein
MPDDPKREAARQEVRTAQKQFERDSKATREARCKAFANAQAAGLSLREIAEETGCITAPSRNNFGTTAVSYGLPYEVERFDEASGRWELDSLTPSGFPSVGFSLGAGQAGDCQSLVLPAETLDGRYRLIKEAQTGSGTQRFVSKFSVGSQVVRARGLKSRSSRASALL